MWHGRTSLGRNHRPAVAGSPGHHPPIAGEDRRVKKVERRVGGADCGTGGAVGSVAPADRKVGGGQCGTEGVDREVAAASQRQDAAELLVAAGAHSIRTPGRSGLGASRNANAAVSPATRSTSGP